MFFDKLELPQWFNKSAITRVQFDSEASLLLFFSNNSAAIEQELQKKSIDYVLESSKNVIIVKNHFMPVAFILRKFLTPQDFDAILKNDPSKEQWGRYVRQILKIPGCFNELFRRCKRTDSAKLTHPTFFNNTPPTTSRLPTAVTTNAPECYLRFATIMSNCLYGGDFVKKGYYSHGNVQFKRYVDDTGHFLTFPSSIACKAMAFLLALRFFSNWRAKNSPSQFIIYEGGAGNGNLAYEFLFLIRKLATEYKVPGWPEFWAAVKYRILEISPALIRIQSDLNQVFIEIDKLRIIEGDATRYPFTEEQIDEFVGNELVDAFAYEEFVKSEDGSLKAVVRIPYVLKKDCDNNLIRDLESKDREYQTKFKQFFTSYLELDKVLILDPKTLISHPELQNIVQFSEARLDIHCIPELKPYLRHEAMLTRMLRFPNMSFFINLGVLDFIPNLREHAAEIILIDYGASKNEMSLTNHIALRPSESLHCLFAKGGFLKWGQFDMTANVDFTNLYNLLSDHYNVVKYGQQSLILGAVNEELFDQVLSSLAISRDPYFLELLTSLQRLFEITSGYIAKLEENEQSPNYGLVRHLKNLDNSRNFKGLICSQPQRSSVAEIYNVGPLLENDPNLETQMQAINSNSCNLL